MDDCIDFGSETHHKDRLVYFINQIKSQNKFHLIAPSRIDTIDVTRAPAPYEVKEARKKVVRFDLSSLTTFVIESNDLLSTFHGLFCPKHMHSVGRHQHHPSIVSRHNAQYKERILLTQTLEPEALYFRNI